MYKVIINYIYNATRKIECINVCLWRIKYKIIDREVKYEITKKITIL